MISLSQSSLKSRIKSREALKKVMASFAVAPKQKKLLLAASIANHQGKQVAKRKSSKEAKPMDPEPKNPRKTPEALLDSAKNLKLKPYNETKSLLPRSDSGHDTDILKKTQIRIQWFSLELVNMQKRPQKSIIHLPTMFRKEPRTNPTILKPTSHR